MKLATDKSHRDYFYKQGFIEFEGLFSQEQIETFNHSIDRILMQEMAVKNLEKEGSAAIFQHGYDFYLKDETLKKQLLHRRLAEIAVELTAIPALRMGYDQLLVGRSKWQKVQTENAYDRFLKDPGSLQEKSCLTPAVCGFILCLEAAESAEISPAIFPKAPGNLVFFKPDIPLDLSFLSYATGGRYMMVVYVDARTVYTLNERDPHTHQLKHKGHVFGDRLADKLNPLLIK